MNAAATGTITVLGAGGFIGSHLVRRLEALELEPFAPARNEDLRDRDLGIVVDCAGLTADFRERPLDTAEAHVCLVERILRDSRVESLTYVSSARLYRGIRPPAGEDGVVLVEPAKVDDVYNVSKAMGEALALTVHPHGRVVRLSNVYGPDFGSVNFLPSIVREVLTTGALRLRTSLESSRDFVSVHDAVDCLVRIATTGRERVYNVASGRNVTNGELASRLRELTGCEVSVAADAPQVSYPGVSIDRVRDEFGLRPADVLDDLPDLLEAFRQETGERARRGVNG